MLNTAAGRECGVMHSTCVAEWQIMLDVYISGEQQVNLSISDQSQINLT